MMEAVSNIFMLVDWDEYVYGQTRDLICEDFDYREQQASSFNDKGLLK